MSNKRKLDTRAIPSIELIEAICKVLDIESTFIRRMDIVLITNEPVIIEIEQIGDNRLLEFNWAKLRETNER